jgi:hypothetical protein
VKRINCKFCGALVFCDEAASRVTHVHPVCAEFRALVTKLNPGARETVDLLDIATGERLEKGQA